MAYPMVAVKLLIAASPPHLSRCRGVILTAACPKRCRGPECVMIVNKDMKTVAFVRLPVQERVHGRAPSAVQDRYSPQQSSRARDPNTQ